MIFQSEGASLKVCFLFESEYEGVPTCSKLVDVYIVTLVCCIEGCKSTNRSCTDNKNLLHLKSFSHTLYYEYCMQKEKIQNLEDFFSPP